MIDDGEVRCGAFTKVYMFCRRVRLFLAIVWDKQDAGTQGEWRLPITTAWAIAKGIWK